MPSSVAQHIIIQFLCPEGEKGADIHCHLQLQSEKQCCSPVPVATQSEAYAVIA
jgi:hypothetical protein